MLLRNLLKIAFAEEENKKLKCTCTYIQLLKLGYPKTSIKHANKCNIKL